MGVELVDDVGVRVEAVLEGRIGTEAAHDAAVAGALDERRPDGDMAGEAGALLGHAAGLAEDDAGLVAGGSGDVHLGLGLAVGDEEVEAGSGCLDGLAVLARQAEADLGVDPEAADRVDLEGLPPEVALPVLEPQGFACPASLGVADVVLAEGGEAGTTGERIGDHDSVIAAAHHAQPGRRTEDVVDRFDAGHIIRRPTGRGADTAAEPGRPRTMAIDTTSPRTRRALLGAGLGAIAAAVASTLVRPVVTRAADGDPVLQGAVNAASSTTEIDTTGAGAFEAHSVSNFGVAGLSNSTIGVFGNSAGSDGYGVGGQASGNGTGVFGYSGLTGTFPTALARTGVHGAADQGTSSVGVRGSSKRGRGVVASGKVAQLRLMPSSATSHPSSGALGDLFLDRSKRLWFCKGGRNWARLA